LTGEALRARRMAKGWSQRELARRAGIHHRAVQYWERQSALDVRGHAVRRMAEALGWRISAPITRARDGVLPFGERTDLLALALAFLPRRLAHRVAAYRVTCGAKTGSGRRAGQSLSRDGGGAGCTEDFRRVRRRRREGDV
jgi:transcriptional regulator with XRE-family HTH domain